MVDLSAGVSSVPMMISSWRHLVQAFTMVCCLSRTDCFVPFPMSPSADQTESPELGFLSIIHSESPSIHHQAETLPEMLRDTPMYSLDPTQSLGSLSSSRSISQAHCDN